MATTFKHARELQVGDIVYDEDGQAMKLVEIGRGCVHIELEGKTKLAKMLTFERGQWSQVHPDTQLRVA